MVLKDKEGQVLDNVSTDGIIPVKELLKPDELGEYAMTGFGFQPGELKKREVKVLVAGAEFGIGSSREQAVWALQQAGIEIVIAASFGSTFFQNAVNNGLLLCTNPKLADEITIGNPVSLEMLIEGMDDLSQQIIRVGGLIEYLERYGDEPIVNSERDPKKMTIFEQRMARALEAISVEPGMLCALPVNKIYSYPVLSVPAFDLIKGAPEIDSRILALHEDHFDPEDNRVGVLQRKQRQIAQQLGVEDYHPRGAGICHRVMLSEIDPCVSPVVAATDSHTSTLGALPVLAIPVGSTLFAAALKESRIPISIPPTVRIEIKGQIPEGLSIRDAQLMLAKMEVKPGSVIEFGGEGFRSMSLDQVAALCNMVPETFNCPIAVTEAYDAGIRYLVDRFNMTEDEAIKLFGVVNKETEYEQVFEFNLEHVVPVVALPGNPKNVVLLSELTDHPQVDVCYLVSCTNGLEDLRSAAKTMGAEKVAKGVKFVIIPSSREIFEQAEAEGILQTFRNMGAIVSDMSVCGPCIGQGRFALEEGKTAITASNRNYKGRMGGGDVYMGSPVMVAVTALLGKIPTVEEYKQIVGLSC